MAVTKRKRAYRKAARAESEAETRDRIIEATVELHEEVGPLRTTISAIAERAGVQRLTVYRHFPGEPELIGACSTRWSERNPAPDPSAIVAADPKERARAMLAALYGWYRRVQRMLENVLADAEQMQVVHAHLQPYRAYLERLVPELERGWRGRSAKRLATLRHAVQFTTWRSLSEIAGDDTAAAELVIGWCDGVRGRE